MLRHMADTGDQRKITLIWSNRTREHIIFPDAFKDLESRLPGLHVSHVLTDTPPSNQLDRTELEKMLAQTRRDAPVFLCGPPANDDRYPKSPFGAWLSPALDIY